MNESENQVMAIFAEAMEIADTNAREAFLSKACGTDQDLRKEVDELLQAEAQSGQFLPDQPSSPVLGPFSANDPGVPLTPRADQIGDRISRYKLLQRIGEGGCGIVYMAEQEQPVRRKVALKVIKLGMDTRSVVARFEAERQALALMDHPNIAKVLDAGATESGRPYFVMELVRGHKITQYCDEQRFSTRQRLDLFIQVCQAVQHAHQKGIIHRDLKPSNILVTERDGVPVTKVIDFGIAKATCDLQLTDKTLFTAFEQFLGTPAYMSPEQARLGDLDIDTRSDIYSLGVLLYELLTGQPPFDAAHLRRLAIDEMLKTIRETDPPLPSNRFTTMTEEQRTSVASSRQVEPPALAKLVRGDLDWIVMKCLEKDRTRRYETANGLVTDLQRHFNDDPVMARPPNAAYRFKKALSRHRLLFLATSAVAVALLLGVCVSTWQAIRARRAKASESVLLREKEQALRESEHQRRQALENEDRALSLLYASDMQAAQQALDGGRLDQARKLLKLHLPAPGQRDRRGFEWFYYTHEADGQQTAVLLEQSSPFTGLDVARNGKMVALRDPEEIKAFDLTTRKVVQRWSFPQRKVIYFRIAPDGRWIAIGTTNQVEVLNVGTGQVTVLAGGRYDVLSFAADRPWIALGQRRVDPGVVQIWDYEQHRLVNSFLQSGGPLLWWETNSTVLAILNTKGILQRWDALTGNQIQEVVTDRARLEKFYVAGAVASQAARCVVCRAGGHSVLDTTDGRLIWESDWPVERFVDISADGRFIASGDNARIRLAEAANLQRYERLAGHLEDVVGVAFIGATSNLVSCGQDGRLLLWEPKSPFVIPFVRGTNDSALLYTLDADLVLSPDQRYCSAYGQLWSLPGGKLVRRFTGAFLGFSPSGVEYATFNSNLLQVWNCTDSGTNPISYFRLPANERDNLLKLSFDGRFVACSVCNSNIFNILVFDARTGKVLADAAEQIPPNLPGKFFLPREFLPNSHRLAVEREYGSAIWDWQAPTNSQWNALTGNFFCASADCRWIVSGVESRRRLKLVQSAANLKIQIELEGHTDPIVSVAFTHDEQRLASVDSRNELRLWKLPEGQLVAIIPIRIPTRVNAFCTLAFSTDDQRLYVAGQEGVQVLEAPKPESIESQGRVHGVRSAAFLPDGTWIVPFPKPSTGAVPTGSVWSR